MTDNLPLRMNPLFEVLRRLPTGRFMLFMILVLPVVAAGCGSGKTGPKKYAVSGEVTFEGTPLAKGQIIFTGTNEAKRIDVIDIADGYFKGELRPGPMKVEIRAFQENSNLTPSGGPGGFPEQYIPPQYNKETTLTADIKEEGVNELKFELTK
ncbi:hypothetical protein [uncultured Gimesia sp.]|uniref:hypothetical protein n=1 Tax=uncultured Gimesia sp. TaxID=1678688 RepID=UPI0030D7280C|tara:strand:+ start:811 stop:1269 length:459 start_codon:yes stop_codon:yes gene_type:complete